MTRPPDPARVAVILEGVAVQLRTDGTRAAQQATVYAARGWPTSTLGNGSGSRSADSTSSVERAALADGRLDGIDERLAVDLRRVAVAALALRSTLDAILGHATDDDPVPAGTGGCVRCARFCRPDAARPHNRIKAGLCPPCYSAWSRAGKPDRSTFIHAYRPADGLEAAT